MMVKNLYK